MSSISLLISASTVQKIGGFYMTNFQKKELLIRSVTFFTAFCMILCILLNCTVSSVSAAIEYNLTIGGVQVTSDNANDILKNGVFSYNALSKTLSIKGDYDFGNKDITSKIDGLTINIEKDSTLKGKDSIVLIELLEDTTITGKGKLTIIKEENDDIYCSKELTITDANIEIKRDSEYYRFGIYSIETTTALTIKNSKLKTYSSIWGFHKVIITNSDVDIANGWIYPFEMPGYGDPLEKYKREGLYYININDSNVRCGGIMYFKAGVHLNGCEFVEPKGAKYSIDNGSINNANGEMITSNLVIKKITTTTTTPIATTKVTTTTAKPTTTTAKPTTTTAKPTTTTAKSTTTTAKPTTTTAKSTTTTAKPITTTAKPTTTTAKPTTTTAKLTTTTAKPTTTTAKPTTTTAKSTTTTAKPTTTIAKPTTVTTTPPVTPVITTTPYLHTSFWLYNQTIKVGEYAQYYTDGWPLDHIESSDTSIAVIENGKIKGVAPGVVKITFYSDKNAYNDDTLTVVALVYALGDVDGNKIINAVDASYVLEDYARTSTGKSSNFNDAQKKAADVNNDKNINAVDASYILSYYAYASTTKEKPLSLEEFMKKN